MEKIRSTRTESNRIKRVLHDLITPIDILFATPEQIQRYRETTGLIYQPALEKGKVIYEQATSI